MRGQPRRAMAALALGLALVVGTAWAEVVCRTARPLDGRPARVAESTLADVVADGARASVKAEAALVQAGQLRPKVIPEGEVTGEALRSALLYPDEPVVLVEMAGSTLRAALERGLSVLPQPSNGFLQVSGLAVTYLATNAPGERVVAVKVGRSALEETRQYRVAMPQSLAKGTLGYFRIFDGLRPKETGPGLGAAVVEYAKGVELLDIVPGNRLVDATRRSE